MPIQQHALPQDVTGYKFRLVGDMTLKQFLMLAVNIVICVLIYGSPLPFFFRIPLAGIFLILGIGLAFVPVQGRPLDQWLIAFFKSIYAPTQYRWEDRAKSIPISTSTPPNQTLPISPQAPRPTIPTPQPIVVPSTPPSSTPITPPTTTTIQQTAPTNQLPQPNITPPMQPNPLPTQPIVTSPITPHTPQPSPTPSISTPSIPISQPTPTTPPTPQPIASPSPTPSSSPSSPNQFSGLPIPFTPTTPNTIVGLTLNSQNKIVDGVLIEIKTNGLTVRATKSNKLGQFMFARPLENGLYQISAEKTGSTFDTYSLNLHGQIVNPLKIQAKL